MVRRGLAALLIVAWTILAGFDVLEDLDPFSPLEVHSSSQASPVGFGHSVNLANNIIEFAYHARSRPTILAHPHLLLSDNIPTPSQKSFKRHKLKHVYLI